MIPLLSTNPAKFFAKLQTEDWYFGPHTEWIDTFEPSSSSKVLEVGTGPGRLAKYTQQKFGSEVTAVDTSSKMLGQAKDGNSKVRFVLADAGELPFSAGEFDFVFGASLINVVADPEKVISEMIRVCGRGGVVSFLVPSENMSSGNTKKYITKHKLRGFSEEALSYWAGNARVMSAQMVKEMLRKAGYDSSVSIDYFFDEMLMTVALKT